MKIDNILTRFPKSPETPIPAPPFQATPNAVKLALAVESMKRHMTDEGWQIMLALAEGGYYLAGKDCLVNQVDVKTLLDTYNPGTVVIQDKREWMGLTADRSMDPSMRFTNIEELRKREDIFKLTILKDSQNDGRLQRESAEEIGCHGWIIYYNSRIVSRLAPYVRAEHLIRTYHTLDRQLVPLYSDKRDDSALLSGALGKAYPLRTRIKDNLAKLPNVFCLAHPGYHRRGCNTPEFLRILSRYKVSICTSSLYGYALRKIIESTACGCRVITDLPEDEILPYIDNNLIRVNPDISFDDLREVINSAITTYNPEVQSQFARNATAYYDYRAEGLRLSRNIALFRETYPAPFSCETVKLPDFLENLPLTEPQ